MHQQASKQLLQTQMHTRNAHSLAGTMAHHQQAILTHHHNNRRHKKYASP
jgi:hypothetical protein